ncbi:MAG: hypothetical protein QOJ35_2260 [Solirubrobacteraceae bacterium]|jgi:hypothetical protein|nr:hypothetical protein [Solirubrobacteraceae bacterium]
MGEVFAIVARKAASQHGHVTTRQLLQAGADKDCIHRWLADGRLYRVHRGVYAVGHPGRSMLGDYMAAVLACGHGPALSHAPAEHVLKLVRGTAPPPEVTVPTTAQRRRPGIVIHRVRELLVLDVWERHGIPITSVPRTLLDVAPRRSPAELARACHEAWIRHRVRPHHIQACIARNPGKPGAAKLLRALGTDVTLSALEDAFLALLRTHRLPLPRTNIDRHGDRVDCHWPHLDLTVVLLSYTFHAARAAFEADVARRRRSDHLAFTYGDVHERPTQTLGELRAAGLGIALV